MEKVIPEVRLSDEAERLYLSYALSVITSRALPDVRDGLKPVQRRILYAMQTELKLGADQKPKKCAAIVGDVMGKLHPHGDSAIYEALVRMAQDWVLRAPLVYGHGNFGSIDGDAPAAMRYTEARLMPIADELLAEIGQGTVSWRPNYDGTRSEPTVLPARFPNLLVNGSQGIAVGMATSIPPHNLGEVLDACLLMISDPSATNAALLKKIKGPDFPTGGELIATSKEIAEVYESGQGSLKLRANFSIETGDKADLVVISAIPYGHEKKSIIEKIADVIIEKKVPGLVDVRDESTAEVRVILELKKGTNPELVMAYLFKHTPLQSNVQVNLTCLVPSATPDLPTPEKLDLRKMIRHFLDFRFEVVTKRLAHELAALKKRLHILEGFEKIFDALDEIIRIIRRSEGRADAHEKIKKRFGLDDEQTEAILELRLYRLAKLEILVIQKEATEKRKEAKRLEGLISSAAGRWRLIEKELEELRKYADKRKTKIPRGGGQELEYSVEDLIVDQDAFVIVTQQGWVKRQQTVKDLSTTRIREGDAVLACEVGSMRAPIAFFTTRGVAYVARIADIPASTGHGDPIQKLMKLDDGEKLVSVLSLDGRLRTVPEPPEDGTALEPFMVAVTRKGLTFRFSLRGHRDPSTRAGRKYGKLNEGDEILAAFPTEGASYVIAAADDGHGLAVAIDEIPVLSGPGKGVMLMKLEGDASLVAAVGAPSPGVGSLVVVTDAGKRLEVLAEQVLGARGGRGQPVAKRARLVKAEPTLPPVPVIEKPEEKAK